MRRVIGIAVVLGAAAALAFLASGSGSQKGHTYWVELDNAFGLVEGADVKLAGVRAGKIQAFKLDRGNYHARVEINLDQQGFDTLRSDAFCESRPQSLIGEYFLDCQPGVHGKVLTTGATVPVNHTATTIAPDLIQNILRLPERERLRIIINELGAGVAGNGQNLNEAIRRAVPALQQTDRVLAILAQQNQVLADLAHNGDTVITALANNHRNVGRWVQTARNTAVASAERRAALAAGFRKLPAFLAQLRPAMAALGQTAVSQTGALRNLDATSGQLQSFFKLLGPFADASRPALRTLAGASQIGRQAVTSATPTVDLLNQYASTSPELSKNLRIILEHLDDPSHAVETDQRAGPQHTDGRKNYTGLEALLQYVFDQSQAINVYDGVEYILKVAAFVDPDCSPYDDGHKLRKDDAASVALAQKCSGNKIGPNGPGLLGEPNVSDNGEVPVRRRQQRVESSRPATATAPRGRDRPADQPKDAGNERQADELLRRERHRRRRQWRRGRSAGQPGRPGHDDHQPGHQRRAQRPGVPTCPGARTCPACPTTSTRTTSSPRTCRTSPGRAAGRAGRAARWRRRADRSSSDRQVLDYLLAP